MGDLNETGDLNEKVDLHQMVPQFARIYGALVDGKPTWRYEVEEKVTARFTSTCLNIKDTHAFSIANAESGRSATFCMFIRRNEDVFCALVKDVGSKWEIKIIGTLNTGVQNIEHRHPTLS